MAPDYQVGHRPAPGVSKHAAQQGEFAAQLMHQRNSSRSHLIGCVARRPPQLRSLSRLFDSRMLKIKCSNLRLKRPTELGDNVKKSIFAIALTAPFVASIPAVSLAADAGLSVVQRARHYRVVEECGWRHCRTRCPDRYSCAPLYGAYGPWGGQRASRVTHWAGAVGMPVVSVAIKPPRAVHNIHARFMCASVVIPRWHSLRKEYCL